MRRLPRDVPRGGQAIPVRVTRRSHPLLPESSRQRAAPRQMENVMGMFSDLMNKIFRSSAPAAGTSASAAPTASSAPQPSPQGSGTGPVVTSQTMGPVDVTAILDKLAAANTQKLDWRHSIVDLMKLVGMDSSLGARRELAADLKYSGDTGDTATMNLWLHKEVMKKLAENGGKVPQELLAR